MENIKNCEAAFEPLDAELKQILGKRYEDASHLFTPEAQDARRNNRVIFTLRIAAFLGVMSGFCIWCMNAGLMAYSTGTILISVCTMTVGYFAGVCVSHLKGWRD